MTSKLVLGISVLGHDLSISLIDQAGEICFIAEEERYSGIKGGRFLFSPKRILQILDEFNVDKNHIKYLAIAGTPEIWSESEYRYLSYDYRSRYHHQTLWIDILADSFPNLSEVFRIRHHDAHAASAYFSSYVNDACIITADAFGDGETITIYGGVDNKINKLFSVPFYHSFVYLYEAFAIYLGLSGYEKEGKLMGLSSYGKSSKLEDLSRYFDKENNFILNGQFFDKCAKAEVWSEIFKKDLGDNSIAQTYSNIQMDLAKSMQTLFEQKMYKLLETGKSLFPSDNVCCAGGGFYNSVSNGKLLLSGLFDNYYFHPIAGDSGLSLGAAQLAASYLGYKPARLHHTFLGSNLDISGQMFSGKNAYNSCDIKEFPNNADLLHWAANYISEGNILGWCQGRMEVGPRALGNRSILADPRKTDTTQKLNIIKKREQWRPFASAVLSEDVTKYFNINAEFPFMNVVAPIKDRNKIPASSHIDNTARIQTVDSKHNHLFYDLIKEFKRLTGIGVLINTSLNVQGKPIARTVEDCLQCFSNSKLEAIIIGNYLFMKKKDELNSHKRNIDEKISIDINELPKSYHLIILDPERKSDEMFSFLEERAVRKTVLNCVISLGVEEKNQSLENCLSEDRSIPLVFVLPWYFEVIQEMMPNLFLKLLKISRSYNHVFFIDVEDKCFKCKDLMEKNVPSGSLTGNLTEVEEHYLRLIGSN